MTQIVDNIANTLNLTPIKSDVAVIEPTPVSNSSFDQDYEYARGNLIATIEKAQEALNGILDVAQMSQHPRAYEVVSGLIKSIADANKDLLELTKRKQEIDKTANNGNVGGPQTINNNLFVGSTAELQKLIKKANED